MASVSETKKILRIDNRDVRVLTWGNDTNPAYSFLELMAELARDYYVISIDLPGHGKSEDLETDYSPGFLIPWLDEVIEHMKCKKIYILAHSWGATVATHYCAEYPEKVIKMILLDGAYHDSEIGYAQKTKLYEEGVISYKPFGCYEDEVAYYKADFDDYIFDSFESAVSTELENHNRTNKFIEKTIEDLIVKRNNLYGWHANGRSAEKALSFQYHSQKTLDYDAFKTPTLLIYAGCPKEEMAIREHQIELFRQRVEIEIKMYEKAGHMIHYDEPYKLIEDIVKYFI